MKYNYKVIKNNKMSTLLLIVCIGVFSYSNAMAQVPLDTFLIQNQGRAELSHNLRLPWHLSAQVNNDYIVLNRKIVAGDRYQPGQTNQFNLNTASLFVDYNYQQCLLMHMNIHEQTKVTSTSAILQNRNPDVIEEGSITLLKPIIDNKNNYFFSKLGKYYFYYGDYELYHMSPSLNQLLTQTNNYGMTIGWLTTNTALQAMFMLNKNNRYQQQGISGGLQFVMNHNIMRTHLHFYIDYLQNIANVDYINSGLINSQINNAVPGLAWGSVINIERYSFIINFTTALRRFNEAALSYKNAGAKPWGFDVYVDYQFQGFARPMQLVVGHQQTGEAKNVGATPGAVNIPQGLPRQRQIAKYSLTFNHYIILAYEILYDHDYAISAGGTGKSSLTQIFRLAVSLG